MTGEINKTDNMPLVVLNVNGEAADKQPLVNNYSVNSFITENNELTVTRSSIRDPRKYSTMKFKPTDNHQIDIEITHGKYTNDLEDFGFQNYGSQAIRRHYSSKAKCLLVFVFLMLFIMLVALIVGLTFGPFSSQKPDSGSEILVHSGVNYTWPIDSHQNSNINGHNNTQENAINPGAESPTTQTAVSVSS